MEEDAMFRFVAILVAAAFCCRRLGSSPATKELTLWTHWAAEQIKRQYVEEAIADFEKKNPGIKIKASWYEKNALYAALKTALARRPGPGHLLRRARSVGVL
jgi:ABC-type glycerol-3-phosphate transport system substrate-binding protein